MPEGFPRNVGAEIAKLHCAACRVPLAVWRQTVVEGASERMILACPSCGEGTRFMLERFKAQRVSLGEKP